MQAQLRKYKLEQVFKEAYEKPFLVLELLPTKEKSFVELVQKCNLLGFEVKYLKAKAVGGILSEGNAKSFLKGNLVMVFPSDVKPLKELFEIGKLFHGLSLFVYYEGVFYHTSSVAAVTESPAVEVLLTTISPLKLLSTLQSPMVNLYNILQLYPLVYKSSLN